MKCSSVVKDGITSPIGLWKVESCLEGLHRLKLDAQVTNDNFLGLGTENVTTLDADEEREPSEHVMHLAKWMKGYFKGDLIEEPPICPKVTDANGQFRQRVWTTLKSTVPFGNTVSYGELARLAGSPGAGRAVGSAMANNPISLVIPCHRVIKSDGSAGNYSKCTKNGVKLWLLQHERKFRALKEQSDALEE